MRCLFLFFLLISSQFIYAQGFVVNKLDVNIYIHQDGYFDVKETYDINFTEQKHGIYRDINSVYLLRGEGERKIYFSDIHVAHDKFTAPSTWKQRKENIFRIKIGKSSKYVVGAKTYEISYRVWNSFLFNEEYTQFYWNLKAGYWEAYFGAINFTVHLPDGTTVSPENTFVYSGSTGTNTLSEEFEINYFDKMLSAKSKADFKSGPGDAVTVLINLPKDSVKNTPYTFPAWKENGWIYPIFLIIIIGFYNWWRHGRDDRVTSITSYYPPEGIDPAMAGFIIDDKSDNIDIVSLIPYWGSKGLINIKDITKSPKSTKVTDTQLTKLKEPDYPMASYERKIFNGLFKSGNVVLISSLKEKFASTMAAAKTSLRNEALKYYDKEAERRYQKIKNGLGLMLVFGGVAYFMIWGAVEAVILAAVCLVGYFLSFYIQKKNPKGTEALGQIKGFRQFVKLADLNRIQTLIQEDAQYFDKTIGYAAAFGLLKKWGAQFEQLNIPPPTWYESNHLTTQSSMRHFTNSLSSSLSSTQSVMLSSPASSGGSGGGSSGGGFGGGGGGSW